VHQSYDWATNIPEKTLREALGIGDAKLQTMTVGYKPTSLPALNYILIGVGVVLIASTPVVWKVTKKGNSMQEAPNKPA
jgi:hypothetical protein